MARLRSRSRAAWRRRRAGFRATSRSTAAAPSSRPPDVREGEQRRRVRLRLELGRPRDRVGVAYYPKLVFAVPFTPVDRRRASSWRRAKTAPRPLAPWPSGDAPSAQGAPARRRHILFPREAKPRLGGRAATSAALGVQFHFFRQGAKLPSMDYVAPASTPSSATSSGASLRAPAKNGITIAAPPRRGARRTPCAPCTAFTPRRSTALLRATRYLNLRFFDSRRRRFAERLAWVFAKNRAGELVAGAFNVEKDDAPLRPLLGLAPSSRTSRSSTSTSATTTASASACERGLDVFEPGAGGEHKRRGASCPTVTHSAHWIEDRKMRGILLSHVERERERVRQIVDGDSHGRRLSHVAPTRSVGCDIPACATREALGTRVTLALPLHAAPRDARLRRGP